MDVPRVDPWVVLNRALPISYEGRDVYDILRDELQKHFSVGTIQIGGRLCNERRMTCYFTLDNNAVMRYSGRELIPVPPPKGSYLHILMIMVNDPEFRTHLASMNPRLKDVLPQFNAVFVNLYRPPSETDNKPDSLGPHSDDETDLASDVILSFTYCEENGEKIFKFHEKFGSTKTIAEFELKNGSILVMLNGCQRITKHSVSDRVTNLSGKRITGGRINCTFRCIKTK
jgi:alkylated DNA repair dioxygenase AlkB